MQPGHLGPCRSRGAGGWIQGVVRSKCPAPLKTLYIVSCFYANKCVTFLYKNISVMLEGTENDITSSPRLTSRVLSNFGDNKEVTDFLVNLCFVTLQSELLWG